MPLKVVVGNLLDAKSDAIIIGVDGDDPKLLGSVGQQLRKRIDDEDYWKTFIQAAKYPIHRGDAHLIDISSVKEFSDAEFGFRVVILANFYNHYNKEVYLDGGYFQALVRAHHEGLYHVATALYKGGWRATEERATMALKRATERVPTIEVELYVKEILST